MQYQTGFYTISSYKKKIVLLSFLFLTGVFVNGQFSDADSLIKQVNYLSAKGDKIKIISSDSAFFYYNRAIRIIDKSDDEIKNNKDILRKKIDVLSKAGVILQQQNKFFLSTDYFKKALSYAKEVDEDSLTAICDFNLAEINLENGKYSTALACYSNALKIYKEMEDEDGVFWSHIGMAIVYRECGNPGSSKHHYNKALDIAKETGDDYYNAVVYNNLGNLYMQTGDYDKAINSLLTSLDFCNKTGEEQNISDVLDSIGEFYLKYKDYKRALDYFERSMVIAENINDNYRLLARYANMAKTYIALNDKENSLKYISKTIELVNLVGDKSRLAEVLVIISEYFSKNRDYENTLTYLNRALSAAEEIGDTVGLASAKQEMAEIYFKTGEADKALEFANTVQSVSSEKNIPDSYAKSSLLISKILEQKGDLKGALINFKKYSEIKDSLINRDRIKVIEDTEAKYNFARLQNEKLTARNNALQAESEIRERNVILAILTLLVILVLIVLMKFYLKKKKEAEEQEGNQLKLNRKIDLLQSQIDTKNRELTSKAMMISQNNKVLEEISVAIDNCFEGGVNERNELRKLKNLLENSYQERGWDDFLKHFEEVHPDFYKRLAEKCPDLTSGELKICAFLKMNLNTKEISQITNQTTKSIEVARTRIRKKLNIEHNGNLYSAVQNI
ncbi:MAG: tetratricopeptide repeat protein [Ignavibacteria bacterium]|nr:tetratricopeptide repeat protein [Ignavibacteria bacterium]